MKNEEKRYQSLLHDVRGLLAKWQASGVEVFLKLRAIDNEGTWKLGHHSTFQDFLKAEFPDVIGLERYNNVIRKIEEYGADFVRTVGVDIPNNMVNDAIVKNPVRKAEVIAAVEHHIREEGCAPGKQKLSEIVRSVAPEIRRPCKEVRDIRSAQKLRARVKELERENAELKREIERLNKKLHGEKAA